MTGKNLDSIVDLLHRETGENQKLQHELMMLRESCEHHREKIELLKTITQHYHESLAKSRRVIELLSPNQDLDRPLVGTISSNGYVKALLKQIFELVKPQQSEINFCWEYRSHFDSRGWLPRLQ